MLVSVLQIIVTIWIIATTIYSFYDLIEIETTNTGKKIGSVIGTIIKLTVLFVVLCFTWHWFNF